MGSNPHIVGMLKRDESLRKRVYDDATGLTITPGTVVKGWATVGYGRNLVGRGITEAEADFLLANDVAYFSGFADRLHWFHGLNDARKAVILNMLFNLGEEPFDADGYKDWPIFVKQIEAGDFDAAADNMLKTRWSRQVGARAARLAQIMRTGVV